MMKREISNFLEVSDEISDSKPPINKDLNADHRPK